MLFSRLLSLVHPTACFFMLAALFTAPVAGYADDLPRLRVDLVNDVTPIFLSAMRKSGQVLVSNCRVVAGLNPNDVPTLPDAQLARITFHEIETLFDGERYARYETSRQVFPDRGNNCKPIIVVMRTVSISAGCELEISGTSSKDAGFDALTVERTPMFMPATNVQHHPTASGACSSNRPLASLSGMPVEDAGDGEKCVWTSQIAQSIRARFGHAPDSAAAASHGPSHGFDACVWTTLPAYKPTKGSSHQIILRTSLLLNPGEIGASQYGSSSHLKTLERNASFADKRFTQAGADEFVRLPAFEVMPD